MPFVPDSQPSGRFVPDAPPAPPVDRSRGAAAIPTAADEGQPAPSGPLTLTNPQAIESGARAERMRVAPPTFPQKIAGGVEAGLNLITGIVGSVIGAPVGAGIAAAEGTGLKAPTGPGGKPIGLDPAMAESGAGVTAALKRTFSGPMDLAAEPTPESDVSAEIGERVTQPVMEALPPLMGHAHEPMGVKPVAQAVGDRARAIPGTDARAGARATAAKLEAPVLKGVAEAHEAGFTLPPNKTKQGGATGAVAGTAESLGGEAKLNKGMSKKNAEVANKLVREDVGLPEDEPVSRAALARIRAEEGEKYAVLKKIDTIDNDAQYAGDLDRITASYDTAAKSFPHRSENPFQKVIDGLRQEKMSGAAVVEEVKLLRGDADKAYRQGDKGLGRAYRDAANALDNSIDRHLTKMADQGGDPALTTAVTEYRAARKRIAKTYLADSALNDTTGNIDAKAYVKALDKNAPLDGPALTIARAAKQFPEVFQKVDKIGNTGGPGVADAALALLARSKTRLAVDLATAVARPGMRAALGTKLVQRKLTQRAREATKATEAKPAAEPPEPTTSPGAGGDGGGGGTPPRPGPLGDLTPDWETTPGAGGGKPRGGEEPGLVPAIDDNPPTTGNRKSKLEMPVVPGRPDLPDTLTTGGPAESAATERANKAMVEPGAIEARQQQAEAAERARRAAEPRVPVGETKEGQPPIKPEKTGKIPVGAATEGQPEIKPLVPKKPIKAGEATELPVEKIEPEAPIDTGEVVPLTAEQEAAWRKEFGLSDGDAERAKAVDVALKHDAAAVERAAVQHDSSPRAFDREIARITEEGEARANESKQAAGSGEGAAADSAAEAVQAAGEQPGADSARAAGAGGEQAPAGGQAPAGVEIREVPGGFEAYRDGKKVGYLKDNLERGQAKQLGENANVDMVKVDKDEQGKGTGRALYAAFAEKHEGAIAPSGKTEPSAWKLWKRNYPEKVDAFVKQEAARIADGADPNIVARNITDPEIRTRVLKESEDGKRLQPDDLQPAAKEEGVQKGGGAEPPEEVFSTENTSIEAQQKAVADYKAGRVQGKPLGSPEAVEAAFREKFGSKMVDGLIEHGLIKHALALDEGMTGEKRGVKAIFRQHPGEQPAATFYFDRLTAENAPAILMHELGEHFGAPRMLGQERYNLVMDELRGLAKTDPEVQAAWKHVEENYVGEHTAAKLKSTDDPTFMRELAAHLVETQPDLPWVRRLVNEIRAFFYEHFGTTMGNRVDANLIRGMAAAALRRASTGGLADQRPAPRQFKPFVPSRTAMGSSEKRPPIQ